MLKASAVLACSVLTGSSYIKFDFKKGELNKIKMLAQFSP